MCVSQVELNAKPTQHLESVQVGNAELPTDVGNGNSSLCLRLEEFVRDNLHVVGLCVGNEPPVRFPSKVVLCCILKLHIFMYPVYHSLICVQDTWISRDIKHSIRGVSRPLKQFDRFRYFRQDVVNAEQSPSMKILEDAIPERRTEVGRIIGYVRANEYVCVQHIQSVWLSTQRITPNSSDILSKVSPLRPVRLYASRYNKLPSPAARATAPAKRGPMRHF